MNLLGANGVKLKLHFNPRENEGELVLLNTHDGQWGREERIRLAYVGLVINKPVDLTITNTEPGFEIRNSANGFTYLYIS